ncbi:MAG: ATP-dependent sacrificial sulfur transferase LarE [Lachnospiraceae bacterium]|nr:ATP-dependent sacrificial sulfur transferase LarE [Lachnospiraceae bacterium]
MKDTQKQKYHNLINYMKKLERVAVAYSGGVDSTFLLKVARDTLGYDNVMAITVNGKTMAKREKKESDEFCQKENIRHEIIAVNEFDIEGFSQNPPNRCYICKKSLFSRIIDTAKRNGINNVLEGTNIDDEGDYRPGMKAIIELGVLSPLKECGFTKKDIRDVSKELNLWTWEKPSLACLATRIPYGEIITEEKLSMIDQAEQLLFDLGFGQLRVRMHDKLARIEVSTEEISKLMEEGVRQQVASKLKEIGFSYVAVDMSGYRTGSLNEQIIKNENKN